MSSSFIPLQNKGDEELEEVDNEEANAQVESTSNGKPSKHQEKLDARKQRKQQQKTVISKKSLKRVQQQYLAIESQLQIFHGCYEAQYTTERWQRHLFPALIQPTKYIAMVNKYTLNPQFTQQLLNIDKGDTVPFLSHFFDNLYIHGSDLKAIPVHSGLDDGKPSSTQIPSSEDFMVDERTITSNSSATQHWPIPGINSSLDPESGLCCYYPLDAASLFPALLLDANPYHRILDMCSAPGGKALAILQSLNLHNYLSSTTKTSSFGNLTCNDVSYDRKVRLQNVIRRYIPKEISELYRITITNLDLTNGSLIRQYFAGDNHREGKYDRILLDAPCSSERHLLQEFYHDFPFFAPSLLAEKDGNEHLFNQAQSIQMSNYELLQWSIGRNKSNAERQFQLLYNAVKLLQINGRIIYSTCSIHELENDLLVQRLLQKINKSQGMNGYRIEVIPVESLFPSLFLHPVDAYTSMVTLGEKTSHGWQILPDRSYGFGPIYLSVLTKTRCDIFPRENGESVEEFLDDDEEDEDISRN